MGARLGDEEGRAMREKMSKKVAIKKVMELLKEALERGDDFKVCSSEEEFNVQFGDYWIDEEWHTVTEIDVLFKKGAER